MEQEPRGPGEAPEPGEVPALPLLPGFREMALRRMSAERRRLVADLTAQRRAAGLSQTEVAARMGTSQSAVARLETGDADVRVSTLERYAAAIGSQLAWLARARPEEGPGLAGPGPMAAGPMAAGPVTAGPAGAGSDQAGFRTDGRPAGRAAAGRPRAGVSLMITPRSHPLQPFPPEPTPPGPQPPFRPRPPFRPGPPGPGHPPEPARPGNPAMAPTRIWIDPREWPEQLYERLLDRRIVMTHGHLDGDAATRLAAQLLTLDADGTAPIRLEMQNLGADLPAALSVMGILDVVRGPVTGYAGGRIEGPGLGILAACRHRRAYPNALFVLSEPQVSFDGTVTALTSREEQERVMLGELFGRIAEVTGRDADQVRADARRDKLFNVAEAIAYGLVESQATPRGLPVLPGLAGPPRQGEQGGGDGGTGTGDE